MITAAKDFLTSPSSPPHAAAEQDHGLRVAGRAWGQPGGGGGAELPVGVGAGGLQRVHQVHNRQGPAKRYRSLSRVCERGNRTVWRVNALPRGRVCACVILLAKAR